MSNITKEISDLQSRLEQCLELLIHKDSPEVLAELKLIRKTLQKLEKAQTSEEVAELRSTRERYRLLMEHATEAVVIMDVAQGTFIDCNENFLNLFGYKKAELFKETPISISPEKQPGGQLSEELANTNIKEALEGKRPVFEWVHYSNSGEEILCEIRLIQIPDAHRSLIRAAITDIRKRKEAEASEEAQEKRYRDLFTSIHEGILQVDVDDSVLYVNEHLCKLLGFDNEELLGLHGVSKLVHPGDQALFRSEVQKRKEGLSSQYELRLKRKDGEYIWVLITGAPSFDTDGKTIIGAFATLNDITERKLHEKDIAAREEQLSLITENINEVVYSVSYIDEGAKQIKYLSPQVETVFGFTQEEYRSSIGKIMSYYHPDDIPIILKLIRQVKDLKKPITASYRFMHKKTKRYVWIEESIVPQFDQDGCHIGNFGTARDVSQRVRADLLQTVSFNISKAVNRRITDIPALSKAIHLELGKVIDAKNFYIALYDNITNVISFPYNSNEFDQSIDDRQFDKGLTEHVIKARRAIFMNDREIRDLVAEGGITLIGELPKIYLGVPLKTEGITIGVLAVQSYANPLAYSSKDLELLKFVSRQIATVIERQQVQDALAGSEEYFRSITENASDLITILNKNGIIQYESQSHERVLGYKPQELIGNYVFKFFHPEDQIRIKRYLIHKLQNKPITDTIVYRFKHKDGSWRFLESTTKNLLNETSVRGFVINSRDITDRIQTQEKLQKTNSELEMFIYKASHDLKGPLASIIGLANVAQQTITDNDSLEYLDLILNSTTRLDGILNDLLRISRTTQGTIVIRDINLAEVIEEIIDSLKHAAYAKRVSFQVKIDLKSTFKSDPDILISAIQNVIDNGVKYRKEIDNSFVEICVTENSEEYILKVEDNGMGIDKNLQNKVFDMFFRGTENSKGTGLGLYMVHKSVEKLGGTIEVESEIGIGSKFTILLPKPN